MVTLGKKASSCAAVGIVWMGGSLLAQLLHLGLMFVLTDPGSDHAAPAAADSTRLWLATAMPLTAALGGTLATWAVRATSGWPRIPLPMLFVRALCFSIFALALLAMRNVLWVAGAAGILGLLGAVTYAWQTASHGSLGTRLSPNSTIVLANDQRLTDNTRI